MNLYEAFPKKPWDHQFRFAQAVVGQFVHTRTIMGAAPVAAGKGNITNALARFFCHHGKNVIIYNNRRTLTQQSFDRMVEDDIHCGVRAASMKDHQNLHAKIQVASIQTDIQRVIEQQCWGLHPADLVIIDEAHTNTGPKCLELMQRYLAQGARILGLSGSPVGMSGCYRDIIVAATNSELRACGAHCEIVVLGATEMDVSKIKKVRINDAGEFSDKQITKELWSQAVVGNIYEEWREHNPLCFPTLAAAPGVGESVWLSEQFRDKGHKVAHIDAKKVIVNGEPYSNDANGTVRNQVLQDALKGEFDLVCNCEVLQEGFDWPDLRHIILARPYGSLANYLQTAGRGMRAGSDSCTIQDHGGNWHRHGSPDEDRDWAQLFQMSEKEIREQRQKEVNEKPDKEPIICIKCRTMRTEGVRCHVCGHSSDSRQRIIFEESGKLQVVSGSAFPKPRERSNDPPEVKALERIFFAMKNKQGKPPSDEQVFAIYKSSHQQYPPDTAIDAWIEKRERKKREYKEKAGA